MKPAQVTPRREETITILHGKHIHFLIYNNPNHIFSTAPSGPFPTVHKPFQHASHTRLYHRAVLNQSETWFAVAWGPYTHSASRASPAASVSFAISPLRRLLDNFDFAAGFDFGGMSGRCPWIARPRCSDWWCLPGAGGVVVLRVSPGGGIDGPAAGGDGRGASDPFPCFFTQSSSSPSRSSSSRSAASWITRGTSGSAMPYIHSRRCSFAATSSGIPHIRAPRRFTPQKIPALRVMAATGLPPHSFVGLWRKTSVKT